MSEDAHGRHVRGLIGPNAILQLLPVIERKGGTALLDDVMARAGVHALPDGTGMIPEGEARRLHRALREALPRDAAQMSAEAGMMTAEYILANRIPGLAKRVMRASPRPVAARLLASAIERHAWTFAGSGRFRRVSPYIFEIAENPVIRGESSDTPVCHWHAAVFERLYRVLVAPSMDCTETACGAAGASVCRFEITRSRERRRS